MRHVVPIIVAAVVVAGVGAWRLLAPNKHGSNWLSVSGIVEATTVDVSAEVPGTVVELLVDEGDAVKEGELVARLDPSTWQAQREQAEAQARQAEERLAEAESAAAVESAVASASIAQAEALRSAAEANLEKLRRGSRPQEVAAAEEAVKEARAAWQAAQAVVAKVRKGARQREIEEARAALAAADASVEAAQARLDRLRSGFRTQEIEQARARVAQAKTRAEQARRDWERLRKLAEEQAVAAQTEEAARTAYEAAAAELDAARQQLALLEEGNRTEDIAAAEAELRRAKAERERAAQAVALLEEGSREEDVRQAEEEAKRLRAAYDAALARLSLVKEGPRREDIMAAEAELRKAESGVRAAQAQAEHVLTLRKQAAAAKAQRDAADAAARQAKVNLAKTRLHAPCDGVVQEKMVEVGETVGAGAPLLRLVNLDDVWLTVYVPETDIGRVRVGQGVNVMVDSYPGRVFPSTVERISSEAEFTPKYVQTPSERARLVYAVRVRLDNGERVFKPGMPADAVIDLSGEEASMGRQWQVRGQRATGR